MMKCSHPCTMGGILVSNTLLVSHFPNRRLLEVLHHDDDDAPAAPAAPVDDDDDDDGGGDVSYEVFYESCG